jgi:hypothetical protein
MSAVLQPYAGRSSLAPHRRNSRDNCTSPPRAQIISQGVAQATCPWRRATCPTERPSRQNLETRPKNAQPRSAGLRTRRSLANAQLHPGDPVRAGRPSSSTPYTASVRLRCPTRKSKIANQKSKIHNVLRPRLPRGLAPTARPYISLGQRPGKPSTRPPRPEGPVQNAFHPCKPRLHLASLPLLESKSKIRKSRTSKRFCLKAQGWPPAAYLGFYREEIGNLEKVVSIHPSKSETKCSLPLLHSTRSPK